MTTATAIPSASDRPTQLLPLAQLLRLSVYWLGLIAVVNGLGVILQERIKVLVPDATIQYTTLGIIQGAGVIVAVLVQPIAGSVRLTRTSPSIAIAPTTRSRPKAASRPRISAISEARRGVPAAAADTRKRSASGPRARKACARLSQAFLA